jgi:hypothetical protein
LEEDAKNSWRSCFKENAKNRFGRKRQNSSVRGTYRAVFASVGGGKEFNTIGIWQNDTSTDANTALFVISLPNADCTWRRVQYWHTLSLLGLIRQRHALSHSF